MADFENPSRPSAEGSGIVTDPAILEALRELALKGERGAAAAMEKNTGEGASRAQRLGIEGMGPVDLRARAEAGPRDIERSEEN